MNDQGHPAAVMACHCLATEKIRDQVTVSLEATNVVSQLTGTNSNDCLTALP